MKFKFSILPILLIFVSSLQGVKAQFPQLSDSSRISLLTNSPWDGAIYGLFGHTALRINDPLQDMDIVFNYGLFDFNSPNFIFRFAKGETDYSVGYTSLDRYIYEYQIRNIKIAEQVLNLTTTERQRIFEALLINALPENKIYRYNYFYDNCSTRPRDIIEKNIYGTILYPSTKLQQTYRDLIHECVWTKPWVRFGINLVIGSGADKIISDRQKNFLPAYLMRAFANADIKNKDGITEKLVLSERNIVEPTSQSTSDSVVDYPLIAGIITLIISIFVSYLSYQRGKVAIGKIFDSLLFLVAGISGCVIFFLMFFSIHPCTYPNWNIVWLNPLQLIFAFLFLIKSFSKGVYCYHFINFAVLILFLLAWFLIPQHLEVAFLPFILALAIRSGINVLQYKKKRQR